MNLFKSALTKQLAAVLFVATSLAATSASAGLVGVKTIKVSHNATDPDSWLQVSEVMAFDASNVNVALATAGASATASSTYGGGSAPSFAIDGVGPEDFPNIFHSGTNALTEYLAISLAAPSELSNLTIFGRSGYMTRDIYDISFFDQNNTLLYTETAVDARNLGHSATFALPNTNVPEPASLALIGLGLLGVAGARRGKKV